MFRLNLDTVDEYNKWHNSWQQRFNRWLSRIVSTEGTLIVFNQAVNWTFNMGILHGHPDFVVGLSLGHEHPIVVFSLLTTCLGSDVTVFNVSHTIKRECKLCIQEEERRTKAMYTAFNNFMRPDEPEGIGAKPPEGPLPGTLGRWP